jgi:preprotein translocase subunit YajC
MFVSPAYAQAAGIGGGEFGMFVPLILIFVVFYFLMIRPQQKKQKTHREMIGALRRGDRIVTNGGLIGSITRVANDNELILEVASGVKVRVLRSMVADLLSKPQPVRRRAKQEVEDEAEDNAEEEYEEEEYEDGDEEYEEEEDEAEDEDDDEEEEQPGDERSSRATRDT